MNFAAYFYNEKGRYTHTEMVSCTYKDKFDKDGNNIGYTVEKILPPSSTDVPPPRLDSDPVFNGKDWIPTKELPPVEDKPPGPSEMDKLKAELEVTKAAMAEFIMQQTLKGMGI